MSKLSSTTTILLAANALTMNDTSAFLACVLDRGTRTLAAYAADDFLQSHPDAASGIGTKARTLWRTWLAARLQELAAAVSVCDSSIFHRQVRWATTLLSSRGFPTKHPLDSFRSLREVLLRELPEVVRPLAVEYLDEGLKSLRERPATFDERLTALTPEGRLATEYLLALLEGDRPRAIRLILDACGKHFSVQHLISEVLLPAQEEVGRMWHVNEINVAEEHFISATTKTVMAQLMFRTRTMSDNGKTLVAAAVSGNQIDMGLTAVAGFFEMEGWRTIDLGANVPVVDIAQAVGMFNADLLALSVSQSPQLQTLRQTMEAIRAAGGSEKVKIIVGGFAFTTGSKALPGQLGADGYAPDPATAVELARRLCGRDRHR